jgi:hypothetical protein
MMVASDYRERILAEEHVQALQAAREQLVKQRRDLAGSLAKPFERGGTEGWRAAIVDVQAAIDAIDKALLDEKNCSA